MSTLRVFGLGGVFLIGTLFGGGAPPARAAESASGYMGQALAQMMAASRLLTQYTGLGLDGGGVCVVGVQLQPGQSYDLDRPFVAGEVYLLPVGGDEDVQDVDLTIFDDDRPVAADGRRASLAAVEFRPSRSGYFRVRLTLSESKVTSFCSFAVLRSRGYHVPLGNLAVAGQRFLGLCSGLAEDLGAQKLNTSFLHEPGQAAVWGVVLPGGESHYISNVRLGGRMSVALAAGDAQARNLTLSVKDSQEQIVGRRLIDDRQARPLACAAVEPQATDMYTITLTNAAQHAPATFALFGVVQVHAPERESPSGGQQPVERTPRPRGVWRDYLRTVSFTPDR